MTAPALVRKADLRRMAEVARETGTRLEIEKNGVIYRAAPDIPDIHRPAKVELPDDFAL